MIAPNRHNGPMPEQESRFPGSSWSITVVCGASGTGRTRFAYALAAHYRGHVIDTSDILDAARAMTGPGQHPELFYQDAEDYRGFPVRPLPGTAEELATARMRAADALAPAVRAVIGKQPRLRRDVSDFPHTVVTGRHSTPALAPWFAVVLTESEDQILANLKTKTPHDVSHELRAQASMLVQRELYLRRNEDNGVRTVFVKARPWPDAVDRALTMMGDYWDMDNALG
jgi:hypothetical protein